MPESIDILPTQRHHIDLADPSLPTDFGFDDYILSKLMDDVLLVEYVDIVGDEGDSGQFVKRGSLLVPINQGTNLWRKGKVILRGPNVKYVDVGDIVLFPSNIANMFVSNVEVKGYGKVKNGLFLNEQRMFGVCEENAEKVKSD